VRLVDSAGSVLTKDEGEAFATISLKN